MTNSRPRTRNVGAPQASFSCVSGRARQIRRIRERAARGFDGDGRAAGLLAGGASRDLFVDAARFFFMASRIRRRAADSAAEVSMARPEKPANLPSMWHASM